ncbi:MAG TPA: hypothetical protein DIW17_02465 [Clostridiales bacterium]|nr:hypothetical protein [Clostridiales bacterium]
MLTTDTTVSRHDMTMSLKNSHWMLEKPENFPISYRYGGKVYRGMPKNSTFEKRFLDSSMVETIISGSVEDLGVKAVCVEYRDYPVIEWTLYFTASGYKKTLILENVNAIDMIFQGKEAVLTHNTGDYMNANGYTDKEIALADGVKVALAPNGGRPCDHAMPYQRLMFDGFGINISIGWPAQWACEYEGGMDQVSFRAGQQLVHTVIDPGEVLRTPRMTVMFFEGTRKRGVNIWRRWYLSHVLPVSMGERVKPALTYSENGGGIEFLAATEENQLNGISAVEKHIPQHGSDVSSLWWIDAGWYPCLDENGIPDWTVTGTWMADSKRFPNGLAPIGEAAEAAGLEFLVWFEPERVRPGSWLAENHPTWMLKASTAHNNNMLLNLGDPDCLKWICETFTKFIKENKIKFYRQDFNFEPLAHWRENEATDRGGMVENQYVQGYLAFWDYLLMNVPGLKIDSCASGGRRNDLETMRRSVPLHPTDYGYGYHHINQAFRHTLCSWLPYTRSWNGAWDIDNKYYEHNDYYAAEKRPPSIDQFSILNGFGVLSGITSPGMMQQFPNLLSYQKKLLTMWEKFAPVMLNGDFYPLTPNHRSNKDWTVFQFDCPECSTGALQVLRNNQSVLESITVYPENMLGAFVLYNEESGESFEVIDASKNGVTFELPVRAGAIWFYCSKDKG